ncbi:hypothetical protein B0O80DRAFT_436487 [Mortierella sp. GBAus27b]|nr:hypothetical protein B0O80DRAFT_436487 [Mortierella sp. GBAus27b]
MSPVHYRRSKRKDSPEHGVDSGEARLETLFPRATIDGHENSAHHTRRGSYPSWRLPNNDSRAHGASFKDLERQVVKRQYPITDTDTATPSIGLGTTTTTVLMTSTNTAITTSIALSPTATPTTADNFKGQDPLSSTAVQSILGGLGAVCIIAVVLRCIHVGRQHRTLMGGDRRNLAQRQTETHRGGAVPTSEMTLAGRLNVYQARSGVRRSYYPYEQEPRGAAGGERNDGRPLGSVGSFVAPTYEHDVSPPPFMAVSGKPPAYVEVLAAPSPTQPPEAHHDPR